MRLHPREQEKLALHQAGFLAQKRLARGLRLNRSEAIALLCTVLHELIRDGGELQPDKVAPSLADLMERGKRILGYRHVLPGVSNLIHDIQVEGTFDDGVFLLTVHEPISSENGDIAAALYGSFLPIPPENSFAPFNEADISPEKTPGAVIALADAPIHINSGRGKAIIKVHNKGDRPIQVGSHYHFIETNPDLEFDRALAYGKRLDIAAGTAKRFEHDPQTVTLVDIGGSQIISGGNNLASGPYDPRRVDQIVENLVKMGFRHKPEPEAPLWDGLSPIPLGSGSDAEKWVEVLERETYIKMFGPTAGDRLRLGDTDLWIEVEKDHTLYGDEVKFGGGKVIREGMGQATNRSAGECLDLVITNALIIDWSGIIKADIGIKDGYIVGVGKAGNPDTQSGIHPSNMVIGATTEVLAGEKTIITAGAIDTHIHFICPQQVDEALAGGTTTMIGGGTGPNHGTLATTATPGPMWMRMMLAATDELPMNIGFTGKGNDAGRGGNIIAQGGDADSVVTYNGAIGPEETIRAGAIGLKLHEDWGSTPAAIDSCLSLAEKYDVQVAIHTDTLNESGYVDRTIKAFRGRAIHTYHTEGAGGGHAPDIITVVSEENVLPSSTNPTRPYAKNTVDEHFDMLVVCHHLDPDNIQEDAAFADSRIRKETMAAEDVLHDLGAISMISSDSQAMGRVGEVVSRTWRTANKMKQMRGPLFQLGDEEGKDNARVKRFISKYTINPAITHGISHVVGDIAPGKLADLVIWKPENFGAKPEIILKSGVIVLAQMGDGNGSISTVQPISLKPMWGSKVAAAALNSVSFVSQISITTNTVQTYGLKKRFEAVKGCRDVRKKDLKWNSYTPKMKVDPENYNVHADGVPMIVDPAEELPLTRAYNVF